MCGNGVKMVGMKTIKTRQKMEVVGIITILKRILGYFAAALGTLIRGIVVLRIVPITLTATTTIRAAIRLTMNASTMINNIITHKRVRIMGSVTHTLIMIIITICL